ncbi:thaumatin family protein, partial [Candidatus Binatus sp.]
MSLLFLLSALSATAFAQSARQPAPTSTCAASSVTLTNQNPYPIWIGENVGTGAILLPDNSANWELDAGDSRNVCVPPDWTSGIFWARTECNFAGT